MSASRGIHHFRVLQGAIVMLVLPRDFLHVGKVQGSVSCQSRVLHRQIMKGNFP